MKTWAIVPVKPLARAKTRLSPLLTPAERAILVCRMLEHTMDVLAYCDFLSGVLLTTSDPALWKIGRVSGAEILEEPDTPGLNRSLDRARQRVLEFGTDALIVIAADLPNFDRDSLQELFDHISSPPNIVIAPDIARQGTNVLYLSPPTAIPFRFGPGSFTRHTREAQKAGVTCVEISIPNLAFDVDYPEDLAKISKTGFIPASLTS